MIIYGRSDATLNPGGVRIGTAEIYRVVERIAEVEEAVAIGQIWQSDTRVVLFVKLRDGQALDAQLEERIRSEIRRHARRARPGEDRSGGRHSPHQEQQGGRAGGEGRSARHAGAQHRRARQSGGPGAFQDLPQLAELGILGEM